MLSYNTENKKNIVPHKEHISALDIIQDSITYMTMTHSIFLIFNDAVYKMTSKLETRRG